MEEHNNNNLLFKGLSLLLIATIGLNIYRTEMTNREVSKLSKTVEQLTARLDSLSVDEMTVGTAAATPAAGSKEFAKMSRAVSSLESKVSALQGAVERLSRAQGKPAAAPKAAATSSAPASSSAARTAVQPALSNGRVSVSAKVKVDNRYVEGTTHLPAVTVGPAGTVVVNVTMNQIGIVGAVSINSATTIKDENIIDLCKEAALRTRFSFNPDAPDKSRGTITYTFTSR